MFVECSPAPLVVKDGFAVLKRDGGQQFSFPLPSRIKWEGKVVVHLPQRCRRGCRNLFLVLCNRRGRMGKKLHNPLTLENKVITLPACWSWRATVRNVTKREGTTGSQDVLLAPWPSLQTFYFSATSHRGRARCCRILHPLSPPAACQVEHCWVTVTWAGRTGFPRDLGGTRDKCRSPKAAYLSLGKAHSGSHSLCAT